MAFTRFQFTKFWTDSTAFPTVETDETKVREDLQALHDESAEGLNTLMDDLEAKSAAGNIGAQTLGGTTTSTVQAEMNKLQSAKHTHSNKSVLDQIAVALTSTLANSYDRLVTLFSGITGVVKTIGTDDTTIPTSKAVQDAITAAGNVPVGGASGAVLRKVSDGDHDVGWDTLTAEDIGDGVFPVERGGTGAGTAAAALANLGGFAKDGSVPVEGYLTVSRATYPMLRLDQTTVGSRVSLQSIGHSLSLGMFNVSGDATKGRSLYIRDSAASVSALARAIELYDTDNSKFYKLYGEHNKPTPADLGTAHVAYGSYQGTGKYGEANPTVLTFDFAPKLLWIFGKYEVNSDSYLTMEDVTSGLYRFTLDIEACLSADRIYVGLDNNDRLDLSVSDGGKTVSMYSTEFNGADRAQANERGYVYQYLAIG